MLDQETKSRINDCRDILVGKLPDPKSQIEQITIALIYKFMDDMDKETVELGGKAKFFSGDYAKYAWDALFDSKVSSAEMLKLYAEAIESMEKNPNIPELFRNIFKNAYLPYRDPETLRMFLKTIAAFEYSHSEKLGDAFEYLLSVMGSQGDAGQFRTPRHIIDFLVQIVDPGKNDTILDPACGTAGFLISAFKHIREKNKGGFTPDEQKKLIKNFVGYDISPDMVRMSLVNLYLHGFTDPHIFEYDSLSSEKRWGDTFDVVLANPPFMTPKGGIRPHKKFSISSNRSEVLFIDYIAEHLNPKGKAGIIVPEGIIFQTGKAYKSLRKMLVENHLWAVVSLPSGVFNPYSGVKTSILLMDREIAKKSDTILFAKVENDGFDLGAQRRENKGSQLEEIKSILKQYKISVAENEGFEPHELAHAVEKKTIADNGEFGLSGERYKTIKNLSSNYKSVKLGEVCRVINGRAYKRAELLDAGKYPVMRVGNFFSNRSWYYSDLELNEDKYCSKGDLLYAWSASFGPKIWDGEKCIYHYHIWKMVPDESKINKLFLYHVLNRETEAIKAEGGRGIAMIHITKGGIEKREIPLPPLEIQKEIVAEIDGYQKVIDGARMVVENYKPKIKVDPEWKIVELEKVSSTQTGGTPSKSNEAYWEGNIPWISPKDMKVDFIGDAKDHISKNAISNSSAKIVSEETILVVVRSGILKHSLPIALTTSEVSFNQDIIAITTKKEKLLPRYLFHYLKSTSAFHLNNGIKPGVTVESFYNGYFKKLLVPIPSIEVQREIIFGIEKERNIALGNKQLIEIFQQKINDRIGEVWGEKE